jgi:hypothetical protein
MKSSTANQIQAQGKPIKNPLSVTYDVIFDDTGFENSSYTARVGDVFRFTNHSYNDATVYVLLSDGSAVTTQMLGTVSSVDVAAMSQVNKTISASGTYLISIEAPPQLLAANDTGGGKTVTVIIET